MLKLLVIGTMHHEINEDFELNAVLPIILN